MGLFDSDYSNGLTGAGQYSGYQPTQTANLNAPDQSVNANAGSLWDQLGSLNTWLGGTDTKTGIKSTGLAMPLIAGGSSILQSLLGMQQYGLAKDQFSEAKKQYDQNYNAQVKTTNTALEDRQRARVASNPGAYQSVSDYLTQNKVG